MKTSHMCHICHICICLCIPNSKYSKQKLDYLLKNLTILVHQYTGVE